MVASSRAWCKDGIRRALDELDALRAMYAADEDAGSATSTRHPSSSSDPTSTSAETNDVAVTIARDALRAVDVPNLSHVPALDATVRFGGGGATIRVALPPGYPARTRPMVVAECASRHRGSDASWRMQLAADDAVEAAGWGTDTRADIERVSVGRNDPAASASSSDDDDGDEDKDKDKDEDQDEDELGRGEECALSAVEAARQAFLDYIASIPPDEDDDSSSHAAREPTKRRRGRRLVWFHHVKSGKKRKKMREWSAELAVDGVVKCGYPGVVVVQGEARACDEFVRRLRGLGWSAMSVRLAEDDEDEENEEFVLNGSDKFLASASRGLRRGWSEIGEDGGMSALATVLRDADLERFMSAALRQNV